MEKVSIIVPIYNIESYIERCVNSLIKQTYNNIEIILVNDGSTDKSGKVCDRLKKKDNRIKVIHQANGGVSKARNIGIQQSTGKYISFVDGDDYVLPNFIETLVELLINNNSQLAVIDYYRVQGENKETFSPNDDTFLTFTPEEALNRIYDSKAYKGYPWNKLFVKDIIMANKIYFKEGIKVFEDLLFCCQYIEYISQISWKRISLYMYELRDNSVSTLILIKGKKETTAVIALQQIYQISKKYSTSSIFFLESRKRYLDFLVANYFYKNSVVNRKEIVKEIKGNFNEITHKHKIMYIIIKYMPSIATTLKGIK